MRTVTRLLAILCVAALACPAYAADCPRPAQLRFEVTGKIVRSEVGFTQGLEWRDGKLFESTGAVGNHSGLNTIAPDGKVTNLRDDRTRYFGEGLTILNDELFQLTWTEHDVFVYDLAGKLASHSLSELEAPTGTGQHDLGPFVQRQLRHAVGE